MGMGNVFGGYIGSTLSRKAVSIPSTLLNGLTAYYSFTSLLVDSTGRGNSLTNGNVVTQVAGKVGDGANFDNSGTQYLSAVNNNDVAPPTGSFSIALWVKSTDNVSNKIISTLNRAANLGFEMYFNTGVCFFTIWPSYDLDPDGVVGTNTSLSLNVWHLIIASWDSVTKILRIREDNLTASTTTQNQSGYTRSSNNLLIADGDPSFFTNLLYKGVMDEIGIWNRVLTPGEEVVLYNGGNGTTYPFNGLS